MIDILPSPFDLVVSSSVDSTRHAPAEGCVRVLVLGTRARAMTLSEDERAAEVVPYGGRDIELRFASTVSSRWLDRWADVMLVDSEELGSREGLWLDIAWGFGVPTVLVQPSTGFPSMDTVDGTLCFARLRADHWREPAVLDALVRAALAGEDGVPTRDFEAVRNDDLAPLDPEYDPRAVDLGELRDHIGRVPVRWGESELSLDEWFAQRPLEGGFEARRRLEGHVARGATSFDLPLTLDEGEAPVPVRFRVSYTSLGAPRTITARRARRSISAGFSNIGDESATAAYPLVDPGDNRLIVEVQTALDDIGRGDIRGVALAVIDVANVEIVRHRLGQDAADSYVETIAGRTRGRVGRVDETAIRLGDRIAVVRRGVASEEGCEALVTGLREAFLGAINVGLTDVFPEVTVGATWCSDPDEDATQLLRDAVASIFWARQGRRQDLLVVEFGGVEPAADRLLLEAEVAQTLIDGEIDLFFQPVFDTASQQATSAEALLRWRHPARGWMSTASVLDMIQRLGLMHVLTRRVFQRACRWLVSAPLDPTFAVSVNVCREQVVHRDFVDDIRAVLAETRLAPARLAVEISAASLDDSDGVLAGNLYALSAIGVRVHVDAFGIGSASISALMDHPIQLLKFDSAFVHRAAVDARAEQAMLRMVQLAGDLDVAVAASGVETREQAALIERLGCRLAQGYLYCCPLEESGAAANFMRLTDRIGA